MTRDPLDGIPLPFRHPVIAGLEGEDEIRAVLTVDRVRDFDMRRNLFDVVTGEEGDPLITFCNLDDSSEHLKPPYSEQA